MNDKNEKENLLSLEELDSVSGGTINQTVLDTEFLRDIGMDIKGRTSKYVHQYFSEVSEELRQTWLKLGVFCEEITTSTKAGNVYTDLKGNVISRTEAMKIAMKARGLTSSDIDIANYGEH